MAKVYKNKKYANLDEVEAEAKQQIANQRERVRTGTLNEKFRLLNNLLSGSNNAPKRTQQEILVHAMDHILELRAALELALQPDSGTMGYQPNTTGVDWLNGNNSTTNQQQNQQQNLGHNMLASQLNPLPYTTATQHTPLPYTTQHTPLPYTTQHNPLPYTTQHNPLPYTTQHNPLPYTTQHNPLPYTTQHNPLPYTAATQHNPLPYTTAMQHNPLHNMATHQRYLPDNNHSHIRAGLSSCRYQPYVTGNGVGNSTTATLPDRLPNNNDRPINALSSCRFQNIDGAHRRRVSTSSSTSASSSTSLSTSASTSSSTSASTSSSTSASTSSSTSSSKSSTL